MQAAREKSRAFEQALKENIEGDVLFDRISRVLYSTDASNYQIEPIGVVLPLHSDDICAVVEIAGSFGVPIIPRGSGSSMAGQTLGAGLILDCAKYLNRIIEIDHAAKIAVVEPGVILDTLNSDLKHLGLMFGPDPASAERATIGGMVGNNATGAHSIRYGLTIDHVLATDVILQDGTTARFEALSLDAFNQRKHADGLEGKIYTRIDEIRDQYAKAIKEHWPSTWRRASGYSLNYLTGFTPGQPPVWHETSTRYPPTAGHNLAPLMVASEGTLAVLRSVTLILVNTPSANALAILPFNSIAEAAEATPGLLKLQPDAVELIPRSIFERARAIPAYARRMGFLEGDPAAILVVEFEGEDQREASLRAAALPGAKILDHPREMADLWAVRKVGLGLLMSIPGDLKPITFIEDVAVPVEHLADYVRDVEAVLMQNDTYGEWYAHASAGCLHLRPLVNLKTSEGVTQMQEIAEAVLEITLNHKGSISGEHGDGLSHTEFNERLFGAELMQAFREVKQVFDPEELLNPGKVIPASDGFGGPGSLVSNLRYGPEYQTKEPLTIFSHRREGGFAEAVEACTGVGVCRQEHGLMCPSYQATRDEIHTTRGRANALRAAISGVLPSQALTSEQMLDVLDLCLECKGCKAECPTAVDMARIKAEFLHLYQEEHGVPLRSRLFAQINKVAAFSQPFAGVVNQVTQSPIISKIQEQLLGIAKERKLPSFSTKTFQSWFTARHSRNAVHAFNPASLILFVDTYTQYMQPEIGQDAVMVLEALGYAVEVVEGQVCCGRPLISKGLLREARASAQKNIEALSPAANAGMPIIGLEPSCLLALRDEYLEFFPHDEGAQAIADHAYLFEEFLVRPDESGKRPIDDWGGGLEAGRAALHNHCHSKALVGSEAFTQLFGAMEIDALEIPSGCCGMAGSFGYEKEHYALSQQIGETILFPAVRDARSSGREVLSPGYSCRTQIQDSTGVSAMHPAQFLARSMRLGTAGHRTSVEDRQ